MHRRFPRGRWTCPHEEREWHVQAERLGREIVATASPSLKRMLERDLEVLLGGVLIFEASVALEEVSA